MPDETPSLDRQMGEVTVSVEYMKKQLDRIADMLDKQQTDIDGVKQQLAEIRGAKKTVEWIRSIVSGLVGAVATAIGLFLSWGGK